MGDELELSKVTSDVAAWKNIELYYVRVILIDIEGSSSTAVETNISSLLSKMHFCTQATTVPNRS